MDKKWTKENQALWDIYKTTIRAFKVAGIITLQQEEKFINDMNEICSQCNF
jgi:hypothetical protein